jgi:enoyl-CoA hydratase/carnithine racemase
VTDTGDGDGGRSPVVVIEEIDGGAVRVVRFNRPQARNAFNSALYDAVVVALTDAAAADGCHVVVLTGTGSAFSAGQDLKEMAQLVTGEASPEAAEGFRGLLDTVQCFEKPLLAAVNGVGVGLGFTLLPHCDLVFMADDARLRVPFTELGVPPEAASSFMFPRTMGWQRAAKFLFTGAWMDAQEAVDAGIALAHYPAESLMDETLAVARTIAVLPPDAVQASKRLLLATRNPEVTAAREREDAGFVELLGSTANLAALERFGTTPSP